MNQQAAIKRLLKVEIMQTTNGYEYTRRGDIFTILVPMTQGLYTPGVQQARIEIINSFDYVKEVRIKKFSVEF